MLQHLLPSFVACAETREDRLDIELFPSERVSLGRAVEKRRREFKTGRACARAALGRLGAPVLPIPSGEHGEPRWPSGVVGSITHCHGYRACAVAWSEAIASLGIDAEPNTPLPDDVLGDVAYGRELDLVSAGAGQVDAGRLLFSAKEALFKAWFPVERRWLGFEDAAISIDPENGTFRARLLAGPLRIGDEELSELNGRWAARDGVVLTAVAVPSNIR